ncbi:hypothetical protein EJW89_06590, partial [Escherichia coli]|nr:hypothetical protein [Escherichia coli]
TFCVVLSDVMCAGRGADIKKAAQVRSPMIQRFSNDSFITTPAFYLRKRCFVKFHIIHLH